MNKKLRTRILIVIVAGLWGYNIYRTVMNYQAKKELDETQEVYNAPTFSPVMFNRDSFELVLPDVDPFLKRQSRSNRKIVSTNSTNNIQKKIKKPPKKEIKAPIKWPKIKYLGFVRNHDNKDPLCLVQINGRTTKLSVGDKQSGIFLSRAFRDSVHMVYSGEERTFRKG